MSLGAFVEGALRGYALREDFRNSREDREIRREDRARRIGIEDRQNARTEQDWAWLDEQRQRQRGVWGQEDEDRDFWLDTFGGADTYARAGQGVIVNEAPPAARLPTGRTGTGDGPVSFGARQQQAALRDGIVETANALGMAPQDLATIISYETAGTFDPTKRGPTTQWGQHRGLIQFGEPQARQHGVDWSDPLGSQLGADGAVARYFRANGYQPGMGLLDAYSIVNAGAPGRYNASDAGNGGAPGTVSDKVRDQMAGHRAKAYALLGQPAAGGGSGRPVAPGRARAPLETAGSFNPAAPRALMAGVTEMGAQRQMASAATPDQAAPGFAPIPMVRVAVPEAPRMAPPMGAVRLVDPNILLNLARSAPAPGYRVA